MIDEGQTELGEQKEDMLPVLGVVWLEASESATQSVIACGEFSVMVLNEFAMDCYS
jgi:hypothetical protein